MIANLSDAMTELGRTAVENERLRERIKDLEAERDQALNLLRLTRESCDRTVARFQKEVSDGVALVSRSITEAVRTERDQALDMVRSVLVDHGVYAKSFANTQRVHQDNFKALLRKVEGMED